MPEKKPTPEMLFSWSLISEGFNTKSRFFHCYG